MSSPTSSKLVELLEHPNAWHRETAARLIYERQDESIRDQLSIMALQGTTPQSRIHALWALNGLRSLTADIVHKALSDSHPRVSEQAIRLSERFLKTNKTLSDKLLSLAKHDDARLRFQLALSLGETGEKNRAVIIDELAEIAFRSATDPWTRIAAAGSVADDPVQFLKSCYLRVEINAAWKAPGLTELIAEAAEVIGSRRKAEEIRQSLFPVAGIASLPARGELDDLPAEIALIEGLGRGLNRRGKSLQSYVVAFPKPLQEEMAARFQKAVRVANSVAQETSLRLKAISILRHTDFDLVGKPLLKLAEDGSNRSLQLAAIDTLSRFHAVEIGKTLLANFAAQTPAVRRAILDALLADENRTNLLLDEIEAKRLTVSELDPGRTNRLSRHKNPEIRKRAKKLLAASVPEDRKKVLSLYQPTLSLKADPKQGQLVFQKNCAACHRIGKIGVNVAPDLADSRTKTPSYLLTSILDPNRAVDNNYFSYTVVTTQGKVITGIISAETATSVTLRQAENKTVTILRQDIDEIRSNGISLMPVGLEKNIKPQQMADLISYIKNWRYLDGRIPIEVGRE